MKEFERNVWCFLGIPVDVISYRQAVERVLVAAVRRQRCFFSTPNLNFMITALGERSFLESVIASDLVLLDGMPPVWIAKILGIPEVEKISGSNLFESLCDNNPADTSKLRVYLFGGEEGVAAAACERINRVASGVECVGHLYPGFEPVDVMSDATILAAINSAGADFVVVALGAKKGQAWIMANRDKIEAPLISHLGAVVNFAACRVVRAPAWMQRLGLEWIWRIGQEPPLWKRYLFDGLQLLKLMLLRVVPYAIWRVWHARGLKNATPVEFTLSVDERRTTIALAGDCLHKTIAPLRPLFDEESKKCRAITIDLAKVGFIDGAFLGLCLLLYRQALEHEFTLSFVGISSAQRRIFNWNCAGYLL